MGRNQNTESFELSQEHIFQEIAQALYAAADEGMFVVNEAGLFIEANAAACQLIGCSPKALRQLSLPDIFTDDGWLRDINGRFHPIILHKRLLPNGRQLLIVQPAAERLGGVPDISPDITEHRQSEDALRQSEERFSKAFQLSPAALSLTRSDGTILDINEAYERLSGYRREELINRDVTEFGIFTPQQRAELRRQMADGRGRLREAELTIRSKSGELRHVLYSVEVVEINGEPCALALAFDITRSRQAEATIEQLNRRMELILHSAGEGIYGVDVDGRITFVNPAMAQMVGWEPAELLGQEAHSLLHHSRADGSAYPLEECAIWLSTRQGRVFRGDEDIYWHKDGRLISIEFTSTPILEQGQVLGVVVVVRDVTQRKKSVEEQLLLEEQLRQAQKMESIGRLAGGVAHDFNNQLAVIELYGDPMRHKMPNDDPLLPKLEQIRQAVDRATHLTRQLLAFSRKQVLQPVVLDMNALITNLESMLGRLIGEDIMLSTDLQPGLWPVTADPGQLEQVIMNLTINARDAMPIGGMLTIETRNIVLDEHTRYLHQDALLGPTVLIAITDTGHGMDRVTRKQIFEPFFTTKQPGKGTGLGLATVHGIVKQSGGTIYVYSEPDRGTTFKIYLPASKSAVDLQAAAAPEAAQRGYETILLVEDEEALRQLVCMTLQEIGYTVLEAYDGSQALVLAEQYPSPIALLLTDVVLPHKSGRELAEQLVARRPETKVLFMSGYMDDAVMRHGVLAADVNFLSKPFSRSALASKVREVLDKPARSAPK